MTAFRDKHSKCLEAIKKTSRAAVLVKAIRQASGPARECSRQTSASTSEQSFTVAAGYAEGPQPAGLQSPVGDMADDVSEVALTEVPESESSFQGDPLVAVVKKLVKQQGHMYEKVVSSMAEARKDAIHERKELMDELQRQAIEIAMIKVEARHSRSFQVVKTFAAALGVTIGLAVGLRGSPLAGHSAVGLHCCGCRHPNAPHFHLGPWARAPGAAHAWPPRVQGPPARRRRALVYAK